MPVVDFDVFDKPSASDEGSEYAPLIAQLAEDFDRTATIRLAPDDERATNEKGEDITIKRILRKVNAAAKSAGYSLREWDRDKDTVTVSVRKPRPRKPKDADAAPAENAPSKPTAVPTAA